ncbi:MAG: histidine phosphatase family protein [Amylibacter sp.]|nr:histidine phosphatase family protein [Amylibacter sp.]
MPDYPPIYILRHGQTEWNLQRRCQGQMNSGLTALGRAQAADQGVLLGAIFAAHPTIQVVCSPQGRARETAQIALVGNEVPIRFDPRVAEVGAGVWTGLPHDVIAKKWPALFNDDITIFEASLNAVKGEGYEGLTTRCLDFLSSLTGPTVVITHGITSMVLRGLVCGLDFNAMKHLPFTQGCIFALIEAEEQIRTRRP